MMMLCENIITIKHGEKKGWYAPKRGNWNFLSNRKVEWSLQLKVSYDSSMGAFIFAFSTSLKGPKSPIFSRSTTLGMVANWMVLLLSFGLLGSEPPMQLSHSSVTTKVMRIPWPCFEDNDLQTPIMALMWPWHGKGIAATCRKVIDSIYMYI